MKQSIESSETSESHLGFKQSVPSREELFSRLKPDSFEPERLVVTPLIDPKNQVQNGNIDIRLGTKFVLAKRAKFDSLDPLGKKNEIEKKILGYQEKMYVGLGKKLILHPGQFVLGSTLEYVKLPVDLIAYVIGRSSWGRLGLIIATATLIHSGYAGIITLELTNIGDTPIRLYPGIRVAQLALHQIGMSKDEKIKKFNKLKKKRQSKYHASVYPSFSKIHTDREWAMLQRLSKPD